jgi:glycosyltransferase involved in cell wall biosynthesis
LRVLLLAQFYPPVVGGEEHAVRNLAVGLVERGHDVTVATIRHEHLPQYEIDRGVKIRRLRSTSSRVRAAYQAERLHAPPAPDIELMRELRRLVEDEQPDIVHAHNWIVHSFLPLRIRRTRPLLLSLHDYSLICAVKRLFRKGAVCSGPGVKKCIMCSANHYGPVKGPLVATALLGARTFAAKRVDLYLPVSNAVAQASGLLEHALPHEVVPNFVSADLLVERESDPVAIPVPDGDFILYVGDVTDDKGVHTLLHAYGSMRASIPLVLAGRTDWDHRRALPENVIMTGPLSHQAILEAFRRSTVAVVPSIVREAFGMVAVEAMALGKPVVASRTGGLADIVVHEETGLLVPPGDASELRTALNRIVADPELRARFAANARARIKTTYSDDVVLPRVEQIYRRLLVPAADGAGGGT